mmetsp:Transcript_38908/g.97426  ORF Transcript_38908/g.97426 Transcript_38908/m.97426 type:complete len:302 (+) Transcript_38908:640-1545(+)
MAAAAAAGARVRWPQADHPQGRQARQRPARRGDAQAGRLRHRQGHARQVCADHRGGHTLLHGTRAAVQGEVRHEERHLVPRVPHLGALDPLPPQPEQGGAGGPGAQGPQQAQGHVVEDGTVREVPGAHPGRQEDARPRAGGEGFGEVPAGAAHVWPQEAAGPPADVGAGEGCGGRDARAADHSQPPPAAAAAAAAAPAGAAAAPAGVCPAAPDPPRAAPPPPRAGGPCGPPPGRQGGRGPVQRSRQVPADAGLRARGAVFPQGPGRQPQALPLPVQLRLHAARRQARLREERGVVPTGVAA